MAGAGEKSSKIKKITQPIKTQEGDRWRKYVKRVLGRFQNLCASSSVDIDFLDKEYPVDTPSPEKNPSLPSRGLGWRTPDLQPHTEEFLPLEINLNLAESIFLKK